MMRTTVSWVTLVLLAGCFPTLDVGAGGPGGSRGHSDAGGGFGGAGGGFGSCNIRGDDGGIDNSPVVEPTRALPPISGGTMAVLSDDTVVVADSDRDQIYVLSPTNADLYIIALSPNDEPGRVAIGPLQRVFVTLRKSGQVAEVDVTTKKVVARHAICPAPRGLAWSSRTQSLTVACATGELVTMGFTVSGTALVPSAPVVSRPGPDLRDVVVTNDGVLVSSFRSTQVLKVADDGTVTQLASPNDLGLAPRGLVARVAWRMAPGATDGAAVMVHQYEKTTLVQTTPGTCSPYGNGAVGLPFDGGSSGDGGLPVGPETNRVVQAAVSQVGAATVAVLARPLATLPVDVAQAVDGRLAIAGAGRSSVFFTKPTMPGQVYELPVKGQPVSVGFRGTTLVAFIRQPASLDFYNATTGERTQVTLSATSVKSTGHDLFHTATPSGLACASCHPEAGDDGHIWQVSEGARRTPTLRGGLSSTEPFHWSGDQATMEVLVSNIMTGRMGDRVHAAPHPAAMLNWLDAQPALPAPSGLDHSAVARGRILFEGVAACAGCHQGTLGTNNGNANIGTGTFQVPRLTELGTRAPYFHDGRVPTLEDRFTALGGEQHGNTSALSAAETADLVEYLRSR